MTKCILKPPQWLDEVDSTSNYLKDTVRISPAACVSGLVIAAKRQTRGRGRMGNVWHSGESGDLMFSFAIVPNPTIPLAAIGTLPQAVALAISDFCQLAGVATLIRWPNDVLTRNGKICGILAESIACADGAQALVTGVGVNLRNDPARNTAAGQAVADIEEESGQVYQPEQALLLVMECLEKRIGAWQQAGFAALKKDLTALLWGKGTSVAVRTGSGRKTGVINGLGESGELLLTGAGGEIIPVHSVAGLEPV
ncbi:MAG: biotin--[acetyl-CoA-carboxylase] ligase [Planctomycetes bacterium]|nr:biotin--[acetyl-CoA-carboxylase] ligase [Planctomycetota bacterium]